MAKSIEFKIRFKAAVICMIVAAGVVVTILYLSVLRREISSQRLGIEHQQALLSAVNELIFAVGEAQSSSSLYLSTKNKTHLSDYICGLDRIETLIDTLAVLKPDDERKLNRIESLLREQARNITRLNVQLAEGNPVNAISDRIQEYDPRSRRDTLYVVNIQQDTVISERPRRGFFRRLGDVFKSGREEVRVTVTQRADTVKTLVSDSLAILSEVGGIAREAQEDYARRIKIIERRVNDLISTDKGIVSEISALLLEFHEETLAATLSVIGNSEKSIRRNYAYSIAGGVLALILILVFIGLIIADINRGAEARRALERANERTRQIMESRHWLLLSVSHDIKTPLNSISGYLELMKDEPNVPSMLNSSEHIRSMLENLLEFSSLEQGTLQASESDFSLRGMCCEIYDLFLPLAQQKRLSLSVEADDVRVRADRIKLKQIVINLVSNGIKYTPNGSVALRACHGDGMLRIEVKDTGAGIPADKLPQLFKPFSRIEQNNALAEGTGLGMFVVKGLCDLLGGRIAIDSKEGAGTTVSVAIPVGCARRDIPQGAKQIRVCDDDPVVVKMVSDMLLRLGHKLSDTDCDLIITDLEMGVVSGLDILREADGVPVVVMTGRADFSTAQAEALGFCGFLAKPFSLKTLRETVGGAACFDELLGDDGDEIMALFRTSAEENFGRLRQALADDDFPTAQAVCHKMFPMFAQLGYPSEELRSMDFHRSGPYEGWRRDVEKVLSVRV